MKKKHFVIGLVLVLLAALLLLIWPRSLELKSPQSNPTPSQITATSAEETAPEAIEKFEREREEKRRGLVGAIGSMLNTPITVYGKVVDQNGDPVPYAGVGYGLLNKFNESGSVGESSADENGHITISGVRGAVISVSVYKSGYHHIEDLSKGSFAYGYGTDKYTKSAPTKENPAIFVLHKIGETEALITGESRTFRIPKNGTPVNVDLVTGRASNTGQIKVQTWTAERVPGGTRFYDWRCRVSVPGGGLVERKDPFDFEAPADGYQEIDEIVMPKEKERWTANVEKSYFIRLGDGRHARIEFKMIAGGDHFFRMESLLNPKPGSRNLEYDPTKRVKP